MRTSVGLGVGVGREMISRGVPFSFVTEARWWPGGGVASFEDMVTIPEVEEVFVYNCVIDIVSSRSDGDAGLIAKTGRQM